MEYAALADYCRQLEETDADERLVATLAELFQTADDDHLPLVVTMVRGKVAPRWESLELGVSSSLTQAAVVRATGVDPDALEDAWRDRGDLGAAAEWAVANSRQTTLFAESLTVAGVHETLRELAGYEGDGSHDRKVETVAGLVSNADAAAARYLVRTVLGYMRVGVGDGTVRDAIAEAFLDVPGEPAPGTPSATAPAVAAVERAFQVTNDYRVVAETARADGADGLAELDVELGRPVESMLARKAEGLASGLSSVARVGAEDGVEGDDGRDPADLGGPAGETETADATDEPDWRGRVLAEVKYDGIRAQAHVDGETVRLFTRRLVEVTEQFPEVVDTLRERVTAETALLDGELVGYDGETGEPVAFQEFSRRIRQEENVAGLAESVPARFHLFDCLYHDGESLFESSLSDRLGVLGETVAFDDTVCRAGSTVPDSVADARGFYRGAVDDGHEGVVLKNRAATYQPGRRVGQMLKHKPVMEPLDLVVTRAHYSEGRRSELLGRLYLAAYDPDADAFREVGRLSTGYTDEELAALTERLEELVVARDGRDVDLRPEIVLEVEYEELQSSSEYDSGFALRFPRFLGVREDLGPTDADSVSRVSELYESQ
ncbi:ATP-dependent DNA ligase [Halobaculum sp. MBLA0143]|uniref:ATP-dependent DNA ligase n=1 Tax=Halobaculum sp. MBLA0143 TaxID=3079933 RepID=UPI003523BDF2